MQNTPLNNTSVLVLAGTELKFFIAAYMGVLCTFAAYSLGTMRNRKGTGTV